ncbi:hypothetical protein KP509_05G034800 [Ceratopteris richardii]|nr:hypothetical protein KP509_05G034800 [Ceratopteris richardii]
MEETWTVVVGRRRGSCKRKSLLISSVSTCRQSARCQNGASISLPLRDEECDEALLLRRLQQSMDRMQQSAFFQKFLLQMQSSPVLDLLFRAISSADSEVSDFSDINGAFESSQKQHDFNHEKARRSTLEIVNATKNFYLCRENILSKSTNLLRYICTCDPGTESPKHIQTTLESDLSSSFSEALNSNNLFIVETESHVEGLKPSSCQYLECVDRPHVLQAKADDSCLQVIIYGLGSIADSEISRCQFALILLLKQTCSWIGPIEVFDPVLSRSECSVIARMGCVPATKDEKGRRRITSPTLFYMPHCEEWLYDNVLQANWIPRLLKQIVILGNSFQEYHERWSVPIGRKSLPPEYVLKYQRSAQEVPLVVPSSPDVPGFNNMSWHFF